jgi:hypothetical protein
LNNTTFRVTQSFLERVRAAIPTKMKVVKKLNEGNAEESPSVEPELEEPESVPELEFESESPAS